MSGSAVQEAAIGTVAAGVEQRYADTQLAGFEHVEGGLAGFGEVHSPARREPGDESTDAHPVPQSGYRSTGVVRPRIRRGVERAPPLGQLARARKYPRGHVHHVGAAEQRPEYGVVDEHGTDQGRAADGAERVEFAADVADRHGEPGEDQAGEETSKEPRGRVQVSQTQTRTDLQAGGQGETVKGREHRAQCGGKQVEGARVPAQGAGDGPRAFRMPDHARARPVLSA